MILDRGFAMSDLGDIIKFIKECENIHIVNRRKNAETRRLLGITVDDQEQIIRSITSRDYISGPEFDDDPKYPGEIYIFKRYAYGHLFYIKLKEVFISGNITWVISCHLDE